MRKLLIDLYDQINSTTDESKRKDLFDKLIYLMNKKEFRGEVETILDLKDLDSHDLLFIEYLIKACNLVYNYSDQDTCLSDSEYDLLREYYNDTTGNELSITEKVISSDTVYHKYESLRGTLTKIYKITDDDVLKNKSQKSLDDWVKKTTNLYKALTGNDIDLWEEDIIVSPKFDGISVEIEFDKNNNIERALTRGDVTTNEAEDITHIIKQIMPHGPIENPKYPYGLKTEAMVSDTDFDEFNKRFPKADGSHYRNTRSMAASIINSDDVETDRCSYLHLIPLRYSYFIDGSEGKQLFADGMFSFPYLKCKLKDREKIREFSFANKTVYNKFRCDGSVIYLVNSKLQDILGRQDNKMRYEVAFKFTEEYGYSKVNNIEFQVGLFGRVTPVVVVDKIKLKGNTVEKAALSYNRLKELSLCKDDVVKVAYDIIPYVIFDEKDPKCIRSGKKEIQIPYVCPECGGLLSESEEGGILYCRNKKCPCVKKGKIINYLIKIGVEGISYETVNDFYYWGFLLSIKDIYSLEDNRDKLISLPGYDKKSIDKILTSINDHKNLLESVFLGAIGIEGFGQKRFSVLLNHFDYDTLIQNALNNDWRSIAEVPGFQGKSARKLCEGIQDNRTLIEYLEDRLTLYKDPKQSDSKFKVVFTKVRDKDIEDYIVSKGGSVSETLTKDTNILVVPNLNISSNKVDKAKKYGIHIVEINDIKNFINKNY